MKWTRILFQKRGWLRFPGESPESFKLIKHGKVKWRDYQPREIDPPYWYKWTMESPYSPAEQQKILSGDTIAWYLKNYDKVKVVEPDKWMYKAGDKVEILVGKDQGKQGTVIQVIPEGNIIVVGGLNCKRQMQDGELNQVEQPLCHDEISLLDPKSKKATSATFKVDNDGNRVRVSDESGHVIPWPPEILHDGTPKREYRCGDKDTDYIAACKRTYKPTMDGWEEELGKIFGVDDPPRRKTFWY